jgi:hypothetical protein
MDERDFEPPTDPQVVLQNRMGRLHKVIPPDAERWREPQFVVEFGNASGQILNVAQERNADLIVLGRQVCCARRRRHPLGFGHGAYGRFSRDLPRIDCTGLRRDSMFNLEKTWLFPRLHGDQCQGEEQNPAYEKSLKPDEIKVTCRLRSRARKEVRSITIG